MAVSSVQIYTWLERYAGIVAEQKQYLTGLDAAIGDGDHGINMDRGFQTVLVKLAPVRDKDAGTLLKTTGMALVGSVGGAGGPLYGTFFLRAPGGQPRQPRKEQWDGGEQVRGSRRSGQHGDALHGVQPRRQGRVVRLPRARADLSQARMGGTQSDGDLGEDPASDQRLDGEEGDQGRRDLGHRGHQPARDRRGLGEEDWQTGL